MQYLSNNRTTMRTKFRLFLTNIGCNPNSHLGQHKPHNKSCLTWGCQKCARRHFSPIPAWVRGLVQCTGRVAIIPSPTTRWDKRRAIWGCICALVACMSCASQHNFGLTCLDLCWEINKYFYKYFYKMSRCWGERLSVPGRGALPEPRESRASDA